MGGGGKWKEENYEENGQNGINGRNKGGVGEILLPSASVSFRGRVAAVVSSVSDIHLLGSVGKCMWGGIGNWKEENNEENGPENGLNGRNKGGVGQILLPSASVNFRGRLAAVVTLVSDIHLVGSVGKCVWGGGRKMERGKL